MEKQISVELRLNNTIFKCFLDGLFYNTEDTKPYAITVIQGVIQQGTQSGLQMQGGIICEHCWSINQEKGLHLKEPSKITLAPAGALNKIKKPGM